MFNSGQQKEATSSLLINTVLLLCKRGSLSTMARRRLSFCSASGPPRKSVVSKSTEKDAFFRAVSTSIFPCLRAVVVAVVILLYRNSRKQRKRAESLYSFRAENIHMFTYRVMPFTRPSCWLGWKVRQRGKT